ncbi:MAG: lytic transglycosylase [Burkholderiaceae bacterium]|nr:MAG: lytic transglycosylase [Burkholderiaceae bacterium]
MLYRWRVCMLVALCLPLLAHASPETLLQLGQMAEHGEGVEQNLDVAQATYCEAAKGGNAEANYRLGWMYFNGRGVERDNWIAATLFKRAAADGHEYAQNSLKFIPPINEEKLPPCFSPKEVLTQKQPGLKLDSKTDLDRLVQQPQNTLTVLLVRQWAPRYNIDPRLALSVIAVESGFNSHAQSSKGALGLMQLMPGTAARFGVRTPMGVQDNIRAGLAYLRWLMDYFNGRLDHVLAGYNAGEGAVDKYNGIPPYPETRMYVTKVLGLYGYRDMTLIQQRLNNPHLQAKPFK